MTHAGGADFQYARYGQPRYSPERRLSRTSDQYVSDYTCILRADLAVVIPDECLLNPSPEAAVCAGNVLTSQRITDVVLLAFQACAASQGCCNNLSFGVGGKDAVTGEVKKGWGYYETIAGGSGAGPTWDGASGVQ